LNTLRFADEIRPTAGLVIPHGQKTGKKEVSMAARLIEEMSGTFRPEKYKNTFTEDLKKLIEAKAKGKKMKRTPKAPPSTNRGPYVCPASEYRSAVRRQEETEAESSLARKSQ
jgi:non-homologous end joining protein Ku